MIGLALTLVGLAVVSQILAASASFRAGLRHETGWRQDIGLLVGLAACGLAYTAGRLV